MEEKEILTELLRTDLTDPRASRLGIEYTETFDGDGETKEFQLSRTNIMFISKISVGGSEQNKNQGNSFNIRTGKITFDDAPAEGTDNIEIKYYYGGTNWVYDDYPLENLKAETSWPRISVINLDEAGSQHAIGEDEEENDLVLQIDIWVKSKQEFTINSETYEGVRLINYLKTQIKEKLKDYWKTKLPRKWLNYERVSENPTTKDEIRQVWKKSLRIKIIYFK